MDSYGTNRGPDDGLPNPVDHVITKFVSRGIEKLSVEELAVTLVTPDFASVFKKRTGSDWNARLQVKAIDRLTKANFDIQWMTKHTSDPNHPFFTSCSRGDIDKVLESLRKTNEDLRSAIDPTLKTGLHFAARDGHVSLVEILIQKGFNVNARDRGLKTPLHYACLHGHETIADVLLKNKADISARDASGRTAFHFACCGTSSRLITLLLGTKPEMVNLPDGVGRTGLHYAVWNSSQRQVDIIRSVIENKGEVNPQDEDGRTPLHHASEGARSRAIPILLQKGADITIREYKNNRTPLDLAPNDNMRQLIVVYSAPPYRVKDNDLRWMDQAIKGEKPVKSSSDKDGKGFKKSIMEKLPEDKMIIASFLRDKLHEVMRDIQEYGIQNAQHIKRPYIFTGSWMEGVTKIEEFYDRIANISPLEASIRVFNIFFPYDKPYPDLKGEEPIKSSFYGDVWNFDALGPKDDEVVSKFNQMRDDEELRKLDQALEIANKRFEDADNELSRMSKENEVLKRQMEETNGRMSKLKAGEKSAGDIKRQLNAKDEDIYQLKEELRQLKQHIEEQNIEIEALQNTQADENLQEELDKALDKIAELEKDINGGKDKEKAARFKAGQLFLSALEARGPKKGAPTKEFDMNLRDDRAILKLYRALKDNLPTLEDRLKEQDRDNDGKLSKAEFTKAFEKLKLSRKDILSLLRVCGFYDGKALVGIQEFMQILADRPKLRDKWEEKLFFKLLEYFQENNIDIDNAFQLLDTSGDNELNMVELQEGLAKFGINITDKDAYALFDIIDESDDGVIQLEEFKQILKEFEQLRQEQIGAPKAREVEKEPVPKGDVVPSDDFMLIHGELKIQIPSSKGVRTDITNLFLKFFLLGATLPKVYKAVQIVQGENEEAKWSIAVKIPIVLILKENIYDYVLLKIYNDETKEELSTYFGEVQFDWKHCLDDPEKWAVNSEFPITNTSYPKKKVDGGILIQAKWVPSNSTNFKSANFNRKDVPQDFLAPLSDNGCLEILLVTTVNCWYHEDVFCDLTLPNGSKKSFKAKFNKDEDAYWNEKHLVDMNFTRDSTVRNMPCTLYNKSGLMGKTNVIGQLLIDWEECLKFPGELNPVQTYIVANVPKTGKFCKLYIKTRWISKSSPAAGDVQPGKAEIKAKTVEAGLLKLNIVRARKLIAADRKTSDPMCEILFQGVEKIERKTEVVKNSLTPQWAQHFDMQVKFYKDALIPPLDLKVYDWDFLKNDLIGIVSIDWTEAYRHPATWAINKYYSLNNPDPEEFQRKNDFGEIYIQAYYVPPGMFDPNVKPDDIDVAKEDLAVAAKKIKGNLVIQVVHAKGLSTGEKGKLFDPLAVVTLPNDKEIETDHVNNTVNPIWKKKIDVPIDILKDKMKPIMIEVKEYRTMLANQLLSYVYVPWEECMKNPGKWAVNQTYKLTGNPEFVKKYKTQEFGEIYVQVKFVEEGMIDDHKEAEYIHELEINGTMFINLIFGKGLRIADKTTSDPYVEIKLPNKKTLKTKTISNTLNPVWNFKEKEVFKLPLEKYKAIRFEAFDDDGLLLKDDDLGFLEVEWKECLDNPGKWLINGLLELDGPEDIRREKNLLSFGHIYLQMMFLKEGMEMPEEVPEVTFNLDEFLKEQEQRLKDSIIGKLYVNVIHGKGLAKGDEDSSDSFCRIIFPNAKKTKSEVKNKNLNPLWNFKAETDINILRKQMQPLKIDVWDQDSFINANDLLGYVQIDWWKCVEASGTWAINEIMTIQAPPDSSIIPEDGKWGELYVQVKFVKDGTEDKSGEPPLIQKLEEVLKLESVPIEGKIAIRIIHAKGMPVTDNLLEGSKSDPYVRVILPNGKQYETEVSTNNLNPIWNHKQDMEFSCPKNKIKAIRFEVWDKDKMSADDKVGEIKVSLQECIDNSGKWHINKVFKVDPPEAVKEGQEPPNLGELYVQVRFTKTGDTPDTTEPKMLEDLKAFLDSQETPMEGQLRVNIPHAKDLYANDSGKTSDPFCKILLPGNVKMETAFIPKTLTPIWKYKGTSKISLPKNRVTSLRIEVWDHDILRNDCIGYVEFPLLDILTSPGKWTINGLYDIKLPPGMDPAKAAKGLGQIYLQVNFMANGIPDNAVEPPISDDIEAQIKVKQEKVEGTLFVNIIHAKDLLPVDDDSSTSDPYVKVSVGQKSFETKPMKKTLNPIWNLTGSKLPISEQKSSMHTLTINVVDHNALLSNTLIGMKELKLDDFIAEPGKWVVNKAFKLTGPQHLVQKYGPAAFGEIYLQIKYVEAGMTTSDLSPEVTENLEAMLQKERELIKGDLKFYIIHAKNLVKENSKPKDIDAVCRVKIPTMKETVSARAKPGDKPVWDFKKEVRIAIQKNNKETIRVEIEQYRVMLSNDILGYCDLSLQDIIASPGKWVYNGSFKLSGPEHLKKNVEYVSGFGDVYIQAKFVKEGDVDDKVVPPMLEDLQAIIAQENEAVKGDLKVRIIHAKKVFPGRKLDLYCKIFLNKKQIGKTDVKKQSNNAIWNKDFRETISMTKNDLKTAKVNFEIWDDNILMDDKVCFIDADLSSVTDLAGDWYNQILRLDGSDKVKLQAGANGLGEIYVMMQFVKQGEKEKGDVPELLENLQETLEKENLPIKGKLKVYCVHAEEVVASDSGLEGKKSDPYCKVIFPNDKELKTKTAAQTLTPIWKEVLPQDINILKSAYKVLRIEVFDKDKFSTDDLIGFVNVDWKSCIDKPGQWAINEIRKLDGPQDLVKDNPKGFGNIYIQVMFVPDGTPDVTALGNLIKDLGAPNAK